MKIGLVPMAGKPVHAGHWGLIQIAASENDIVKVFASSGDRDFIKGSDMIKVWNAYLTPALPGNVQVVFVPVPVSSIYKTLEEAELEGSNDRFAIYSDSDDILKYREASLKKAAPTIYKKKKINLRGIDRSSTVNVSGTEMRSLLSSKKKSDKKKFISLLPSEVQMHGEEIYNTLKKEITENLFKQYLRLILSYRN